LALESRIVEALFASVVLVQPKHDDVASIFCVVKDILGDIMGFSATSEIRHVCHVDKFLGLKFS